MSPNGQNRVKLGQGSRITQGQERQMAENPECGCWDGEGPTELMNSSASYCSAGVERVNKTTQSSLKSTQQCTYHLQPEVSPVRAETFSSVTTLLIITCLSCVFLPKTVFLATTFSHLTSSLELCFPCSPTPAWSCRLIYFCWTRKKSPFEILSLASV